MRKLFSKTVLVVISTFFSIAAIAQGNDVVKTAEETRGLLYSNGKIYVVVAVLVTILTGLILYLVSLDRKISRLEKNKE
ncbi:MAG: CcmD family protein [Sphingobacteriales bacterium]|nr:CcmD family protein [Sphingobacteriales bacterium]